MPLHDFRCLAGHVTEDYVLHGTDAIPCKTCGERAEKVFLTPPTVYAQVDICYDSPIDGRPITTKQARIEDLRRNGCRPYEQGEKEELERRRKKEEADLDASVDATVDREVTLMPARKRELLEQEVRAGADVEIVRNNG